MELLVSIVYLAVIILMIAAMWKIFTDGGEPGWFSIIPILQQYGLCKIAGRPGWWLILYFIPIANLIVHIIVCIDIANSRGKNPLFGIGMVFLAPVFFPLLAFGDSDTSHT